MNHTLRIRRDLNMPRLIVALTMIASTAGLLVPSSALAQAVTPLKITFKSTLENYKPYTDEKPGGWRAANDQVGRIGGWRTYLKEANEPEPAASEVKPGGK
jgi:hypothetical protein